MFGSKPDKSLGQVKCFGRVVREVVDCHEQIAGTDGEHDLGVSRAQRNDALGDHYFRFAVGLYRSIGLYGSIRFCRSIGLCRGFRFCRSIGAWRLSTGIVVAAACCRDESQGHEGADEFLTGISFL